VRAFQPSSSRRSLWLALAVAVYAVVLPQCYLTSGDPRRTAIAQLEALEAEAPPEAKPAGVWVGGKLVAESEGEADGEEAEAPVAAETAEAVDEFGGIDGDLLVRKNGAAEAKDTKEVRACIHFRHLFLSVPIVLGFLPVFFRAFLNCPLARFIGTGANLTIIIFTSNIFLGLA